MSTAKGMQFLQNGRVRTEERGNRGRSKRTIWGKKGYWSIKLWHEKHKSHAYSLFVAFRAMDGALMSACVMFLVRKEESLDKLKRM